MRWICTYSQVWDVLSNKEVIDVVASASSRSTAARTLVETAVRAWRFKYPTSKVDDCAVVCLFLDSNPNNLNLSSASGKPKKQMTSSMEQIDGGGVEKEDLSGPTGLNRSGTVRNGKEINGEDSKEEEEASKKAEFDVESGIDWSALEGVSRVNTLLTLPRFVPGKEDKKATGKTS